MDAGTVGRDERVSARTEHETVLSDNAALVNLAEGCPPPAASETHISVLFFAGDRAYKMLKPVRFPFVDFSTAAARRAACFRELEVNRRFAPDVYLDVAELVGSGDQGTMESILVMRRLPADRKLARLVIEMKDVDQTQLDQVVRDVARRVAVVHAEAPRPAAARRAASVAEVRRNWQDNAATLRSVVPVAIDSADVDAVEADATRYLAGRGPLFEARIAAGFAIDGHGDLLAEDIFCLEDGPRLLDCLAFDDRLRYGDALLDAAFLMMDLERLVNVDLAERFLASYQEFSAEHHPASLAHHYVAYRAQVRAKVACLRAVQGDQAAAAEALARHRQCAEHLRAGRVRLVLVGGAPGTGKSTVANGLADATGWSVLASDELRKDLAGVAYGQHADSTPDQGLYAPAERGAVYDTLLGQARSLLEQGETVILDASWASRSWRRDAAQLASATSSDLVALCCTAPPALADQRVSKRWASRESSASDANVEVAAHLRATFERWPEATVLRNDRRVASTVAAAVLASR